MTTGSGGRILGGAGYDWVPEITNGKWSMLDAMGVELESAELLYSLVRAIKPHTVIETGTYPGVGTDAILRGLHDNDEGHLFTHEVREDLREAMRWKFVEAGRITVKGGSPSDFSEVPFTFLDSEPSLRKEEVVKWFLTAPPRAVCLYHDALVMDVGEQVRQYPHKILIPVPRGIWLMSKP